AWMMRSWARKVRSACSASLHGALRAKLRFILALPEAEHAHHRKDDDPHADGGGKGQPRGNPLSRWSSCCGHGRGAGDVTAEGPLVVLPRRPVRRPRDVVPEILTWEGPGVQSTMPVETSTIGRGADSVRLVSSDGLPA